MKFSIYLSILVLLSSIQNNRVFAQGIETEILKGAIELVTSDTKMDFPNNEKIWWTIGNNFDGDFEINWRNFVTDLIIYRTDLVVQKEDGFVGIGQFEPKARLHVSNVDNLEAHPNIPAAMIGDYGNAALQYGYLTVNQPSNDLNANIARFRDAGSTTVEINRSANTYQLKVFGDALASGGMWINSDKRLKEMIQTIPSTLKGLRKLKPSTYYYKSTSGYLPKEKQFGLIAQDLQKVYPHLVRESVRKNDEVGKSEKVLSVNYNGLIPVLISSVQELDIHQKKSSDEISELREENELLRQRIDRLEKLIEKIASKSN